MQQTRTTSHLRPMPRWLDRTPTPLLVAALILVIAGFASSLTRRAALVEAVPTPQLPLIIIQKEAAPAVPTAAPVQQIVYAPASPLRYVTAFAAPDGVVLGPIPWSADSPILGRFGDNWLMTNWENGQVWIRTSDIGANLGNLQPAIAPAQPGQQPYQPAYQVGPPSEPPPPTPEPAAQPAIVAQPAEAPAAAPAAQEAYPKIVPAFPTRAADSPVDPVTFESLQQEWRFEHCILQDDPTTCH